MSFSTSVISGYNICIYSEKKTTRYLTTPTKKSVIGYSDASSLASGVHTVEVDSKCFHLTLKETEKIRSLERAAGH